MDENQKAVADGLNRMSEMLEEAKTVAGSNDDAITYLLQHIQAMASHVGYNLPVFGGPSSLEAPEEPKAEPEVEEKPSDKDPAQELI